MTDVTGFGLKVHASELIEKRQIDIEINTLPIIKGTDELSEYLGYDLLGGCAAETAGPMLIAVDTRNIDTNVIQDLFKGEGVKSWKIGSFKKGSGKTQISEKIKIIHVDDF